TSANKDNFGIIIITNFIVAKHFIKADVIIVVEEHSGTSNAAYKSDNTQIVYMVFIIIFTKNKLIVISLILVSLRYENFGKLKCVIPRFIYCKENSLLNKDGTEPFSSDK